MLDPTNNDRKEYAELKEFYESMTHLDWIEARYESDSTKEMKKFKKEV